MNELEKKIRAKLSEKWLDFADIEKEEEVPEFEQAQIDALDEAEKKIAAESVLMNEFLRHPAWALMESYRVNRIEVLRSKLERLNQETDETRDIRAELRILRGYENFVLSKVGQF